MVGASFTVRVNNWVASGAMPLAAVMVNVKVPPVPAAGMPARVAVPLPLSVSVTPVGSAPVLVRLAVGKPEDVTVNVPAAPTANVALFALVTAGAWLTVRGKDWVAAGATPFAAMTVTV